MIRTGIDSCLKGDGGMEVGMGFPLEASGTPHMDLVSGNLFSDMVGVVKIASEIIVGC